MTGRFTLLAALIATPGFAQDAGVDGGVDAGEGRPGSGDRVAEMSSAAISRLGKAYNTEGLELIGAGDPAGALAVFKQAWELLGQKDAEVANNIGFAYFKLNDRKRAQRWYRRALKIDARRGLAWQNLAELYTGPSAPAEDLERAVEHLERAREFLGNKPAVVRLQARVAARQGRFTEARRQYLSIRPRTPRLLLEIGDFFADYAKPEEAIDWYSRIERPLVRAEAQQRIQALRLAQAVAEFELSLRTEGIPKQARQFHQLAQALHRVGNDDEAVRLLEEALALAPLYDAANILLGDLIAPRDPRRAELVWLRALAANGRNVDVLVRVADLHLADGRAKAAASFMSRAVELAPERNDLRLRLARAWRAAGQIQRALAHIETYLSEAPEGVEAREARALQRELSHALPVGYDPQIDAQRSPVDRRAVDRAGRLAAEGRLAEAVAALTALPPTARGTAAYTLLAFVMRRLGREEEAIGWYHAALAEDRDQPEVLFKLGSLLARRGELPSARVILEEAEAAGSTEAVLALARMDTEPADGWPGWVFDGLRLQRLRAAAGRLETYVRLPKADLRDHASARLREVRGRVLAVYAASGVLALAMLIGALLFARRRWGGIELGELVTHHPDAGPEVQRVLSAIRHEVLKHNTMVLTGLVEAIRFDEDAAQKAAWCRRSLLGPPGRGVGDGRDAASQRLRDYAADLIKIGRSRGARLNLHRRDPALSALLKGFRVLEHSAPLLDRFSRLGRRGRKRLQRSLERATQLLNVEGYEAVRALLDRLRVLRVDEALLRGIFERTSREPAFAKIKPAPLTLDGADLLPCAVAIPQHAFEDVLANLIRNAIQSTARYGAEGPVHIGLAVEHEVDFITGLARAVFRIRDRSPQALTAEMLRGRYIEEGLGLTADLVSRYEGALDVVEEAAPWAKAVVVKLPAVDDEDRPEPLEDP